MLGTPASPVPSPTEVLELNVQFTVMVQAETGAEPASVRLCEGMSSIECKSAIAEALNLRCDLDCGALFAVGQHVSCSPEALWRFRGGGAGLVFSTALSSAVRARERADYLQAQRALQFSPDERLFDYKQADRDVAQQLEGAVLAEQYRIKDFLEGGGVGRGWTAYDEKAGKNVFVKTYKSVRERARARRVLSTRDRASLDALVQRELRVLLHPAYLEATNHEHVAGAAAHFGNLVVGGVRRGSMFFAAGELCGRGELFQFLYPRHSKAAVAPFPEPVARRLCKDLARALHHMHSHGMYHLDIRLENMVVTDRLQVKLMDFGQACFVTADGRAPEPSRVDPASQPLAAPSPWSAPRPRVGGGPEYDLPGPADVWSMGVAFFMLVAGDAIEKHHLRHHPADLSTNFVRFFQRAGAANGRYSGMLGRGTRDADWDPHRGAVLHTRLWNELDAVGLTLSSSARDMLGGTLNLEPTGPRGRFTATQLLASEFFDAPGATDAEMEAAFRERHPPDSWVPMPSG